MFDTLYKRFADLMDPIIKASYSLTPEQAMPVYLPKVVEFVSTLTKEEKAELRNELSRMDSHYAMGQMTGKPLAQEYVIAACYMHRALDNLNVN